MQTEKRFSVNIREDRGDHFHDECKGIYYGESKADIKRYLESIFGVETKDMFYIIAMV